MKYSNQSNFRELPSTIQHPALTKRRVLEICKNCGWKKSKNIPQRVVVSNGDLLWDRIRKIKFQGKNPP